MSNRNLILVISIPVLVFSLYFMVIHRSDSKTLKEEIPIHFYMNCDLTNQTKDSLIQLIDLYAADKNKMYVQTFLVKGNDEDENLKAVVATVNRLRMFFNDDYYTHPNRKRDINNFYDLYSENKSNYTSFFKKQNSRRKNYEGDVIYDKDFSSIAQLKAMVTDKIASGSSTISVVFDECTSSSIQVLPEPVPTEIQVPEPETVPTPRRVPEPEPPRRGGAAPPPPIENFSHRMQNNMNVFSWSNEMECDDCTYKIEIKCSKGCVAGLDYKKTVTNIKDNTYELDLSEFETELRGKTYEITLTSKRNGKKKNSIINATLKCRN